MTSGVTTASDTQLRERIRRALQAQKQRTITVLSSLLAAQDEIGYLPEAAIEETAAFIKGATINDVWSVASFYTNFRFTPPGEHTVEVCWGPSCHIKGAQQVLKAVQEELSIDREGDTADGKFTLRYNTCLGACAQAPVISIDHHHYGGCTPGQAVKLVQETRTRPAAGH
ncbi:MAG: NAD(P)H-dependent oxidoreductase subunit E [Chloroflexi bacterium]|nr:NAD(P)H-dependent oxidoreductase subunit E [Chloroflexota bacterium]